MKLHGFITAMIYQKITKLCNKTLDKQAFIMECIYGPLLANHILEMDDPPFTNYLTEQELQTLINSEYSLVFHLYKRKTGIAVHYFSMPIMPETCFLKQSDNFIITITEQDVSEILVANKIGMLL